MQKLKLLILTFYLVAFSSSNKVCGQIRYGKLKLNVRQTENCYWQEIELSNKDTSFKRFVTPYLTRPILDSIPPGQYIVSLVSVFGDKVDKEVLIKRNAKLTFKVSRYYKKDTASKKFLDRLKNNDTLRIYVYQTGCFSMIDFPCSIIRKDNKLFIAFDTRDGYKEYILTQTEIDRLMQFENIARTPNKHVPLSTTTTLYSWVFDKQIIEFRIDGPNYISDIFTSRQKK